MPGRSSPRKLMNRFDISATSLPAILVVADGPAGSGASEEDGWSASITTFGGIPAAVSIIALVYVVGLVLTPFAGPETKGRPLPP